jgi:hypothetical protein
MKKSKSSSAFRVQVAQAMRELQSIMAAGQSPTRNGRLISHSIQTQPVNPHEIAISRRRAKTMNRRVSN